MGLQLGPRLQRWVLCKSQTWKKIRNLLLEIPPGLGGHGAGGAAGAVPAELKKG